MYLAPARRAAPPDLLLPSSIIVAIFQFSQRNVMDKKYKKKVISVSLKQKNITVDVATNLKEQNIISVNHWPGLSNIHNSEQYKLHIKSVLYYTIK